MLFAQIATAPAFGWVVTRPAPDRCRVERESTDATTTTGVDRYTSLKSGTTWVNAGSSGNWNTRTIYSNVLTANMRSWECTLPTGEPALILILNSTGSYVSLLAPMDPEPVSGSVSSTVTALPAVTVAGGSVSATITTMPVVSLASSVSVDGTLPVEVARVGLLDGDATSQLLVLGGGLAAISLGLALRRRRR